MSHIMYLDYYLETKNPVPTLETMKTVYRDIFDREPIGLWKDTITVWHDKDVKCDEPIKDILKKKRFATRPRSTWEDPCRRSSEAVFEMLDNLTAYLVAEEGIFFARRNEGMRYWHKNGNIYAVGDKKNILRFEYENGKLTAYAYLGLRKNYENKYIKWYDHLDQEMAERWEDSYDILSESETFLYRDIVSAAEKVQSPHVVRKEEKESAAEERTYRVKGNRYDAFLTVTENNQYIVRKGSKVAENWQELIERKDIAEKSDKVGADCILLKNVEFNTISAAAKFIKGCSTSGADIISPQNLTAQTFESKMYRTNIETFILPELVQKITTGNFKEDSFDVISVIGKGDCGKYCVLNEYSTSALVWRFMMKVIEERGEACIQELAAKSEDRNPFFMKTEDYCTGKQTHQISAYYRIVDEFPEWSMCCDYSQLDWLKVLQDRIAELGFLPEDFTIELKVSATWRQRRYGEFT